ncbi:MAG: class I SAM-dependent methyltransferase [Ginsengibacter sp.]
MDSIDVDSLKNISVKGDNKKNASIYQGANYFLLEKSFTYLQNEAIGASFVDFGCGKGRALAVAAHYGFKQIKGIEFAPALCAKANENINRIQPLYPEVNFSISCNDALVYEVSNEDKVFYFFNPFDEVIMLSVVKNITQSLRQFPREVFVIYINPLHKEIFLSAGFQEEYYLQKLEYLEVSILSFTPEEEIY